jgi:hypothetical protein
MPCPTCQHIKLDGVPCGSPALSRKPYCYFHQRLISRHRRIRSTPRPNTLDLDPVGDRIDLQMNLSQIINAVAVGHLEPSRARVLLEVLHLTSRNLKALEKMLPLQR